jgi:hypothetical protein
MGSDYFIEPYHAINGVAKRSRCTDEPEQIKKTNKKRVWKVHENAEGLIDTLDVKPLLTRRLLQAWCLQLQSQLRNCETP